LARLVVPRQFSLESKLGKKTLNELAAAHGVRVRNLCGEPVIAGRNGHLYIDEGVLMICFSDSERRLNGERWFFTRWDKPAALARLKGGLGPFRQEGDFEFIAPLDPAYIAVACQVLKVPRTRPKRILKTKDLGVPKTHGEAPVDPLGHPPQNEGLEVVR
jgi:hypothetical protein